MPVLKYLSTWLPDNKITLIDNNFGKDNDFIINKTGFVSKVISKDLSRDQKAVHFGVNACKKLFENRKFNKEDIDAILFVNQSYRNKLPHLSALIHNILDIHNENVFTADIGLGCTGYVQALQIAKCMLLSNDFKNILIVTSDQYPDYLRVDDHNTQLIFGEGASASIVSNFGSGYKLGQYKNHIDSSASDAIEFDNENFINMNGRKVFEYVMTRALKEIKAMIEKNNLDFDTNKCIFIPHQGSKFIIDMLAKKLDIKNDGLFCSSKVGNLVSTSIPYVIEKKLGPNFTDLSENPDRVLLSGFGVGLSSSCIILEK